MSDRILEGRLHKSSGCIRFRVGQGPILLDRSNAHGSRGPGGNGRVRVDRASAVCRSVFGEQEDQLIVIDRLDQVMIKPSLL